MVLIPDRAILAMMGGQTLIWAALFYSFVALVPDWQAAFGWSDTALMAAFSLAGVIWAITTPAMGRAIDAGRGPIVMPVAGLVGAAILVALSGVSSYLAFLTLWGAMGVMMAATLYEPAFAMVLRARGAGGRDGITAIAIAAGFASTICYPVAHIVSDAWGWRMAMLTMAGIAAGLAVPLLAIGARWLERDTPATAAPGARPRANWGAVAGLPKFPAVAVAFALAALIPGALLAHLFPLMADRQIDAGLAVFAGSLIGPAQVAGRIIVKLGAPGARAAAIAAGAVLSLTVSVALIAAAPGAPWLVFGFVLAFGIGNGLVGIFRPVVARERFGDAGIGAVAAALAAPALFVTACAPVLGALLVDAYGYGALLAALGAAGIISVSLLWWTEPRP